MLIQVNELLRNITYEKFVFESYIKGIILRFVMMIGTFGCLLIILGLSKLETRFIVSLVNVFLKKRC